MSERTLQNPGKVVGTDGRRAERKRRPHRFISRSQARIIADLAAELEQAAERHQSLVFLSRLRDIQAGES